MNYGVDVEALKSLVVFVEFLQNPDKFKNDLKELKEVLAKQELFVELYPTVEQAKKYLAEAKKVLDEASANAAEALETTKLKVDKLAHSLDEKMGVLEGQRQELTKVSEKLFEKEKSLAMQEQRLSQLEIEYKQKVKNLDSWESDIKRQEVDLKNKKEQLQKLMS